MDYTSIKVGQLPTADISGGNFIPHEVSGLLKKATITDLAAFINASGAVGFRAVSISDGGTLPTTDTNEFILVGPGTYNNVEGASPITVTEELNALVSNGDYWFIGVEIPIDAPPGDAIWGEIVGTLSNQTDLQNVLNLKADLVDGKVPAAQLPSYVDDIIEVANFASLPATGETGKIYLTLDNNKIYRWSGSVYIEIAAENAVWGQIVGTLSNQTDLQNALNLRVPYTGATANVDLGTHTLSSYNLVVNHTSGSGVAAQITKGGNGEALTVVKSSGTGNAASITGGTTLLSTLNLTNALADAYIASAAIWNAKQDALNGTGFVKISGTTVSYDNSTYVPTSRTININGTEFDLSANRAWSIPTHNAVSIGSENGLSITSDGQVLSLALASAGSIGALSASDWMTFNSKIGGSGTANYLPKFTGSAFLGNSQIFDNGTNVGIGTDSPGTKLDVRGNINIGNASDTVTNSFAIQSNKAIFSIAANGGTNAAGTTITYTWGAGGQGPLIFNRSLGVETMRLGADGNVGIGTTSPNNLLTLNSSGAAGNSTSIGLFSTFNESTNRNWSIGLNLHAYGDFAIRTSTTQNGNPDTTRFLINPSGNVGIGTTSPATKLSIITAAGGNTSGLSVGSTNGLLNIWGGSTADVVVDVTNGTLNGSTATNLIIRGGGTERMRITSAGEVLINMTSTSTSASGTMLSQGTAFANLRLFGTGSHTFSQFFLSGVAIGSITGSGSVTSYNTTSDYRLKQDFKPFNGLDLVSKIKVYDYEWKADNSRMNGVIAHELQEVVPYAVTGEKDGESMQQVDYSKLVPILVQAIQELKTEIEILKNK
jgi:hypothetical protein